MIETASVYNLRGIPKNKEEVRVLVMRTWPRGIKHEVIDLWVPDAGPSKRLLEAYRSQALTWEEFRANYIEEQSVLTACSYTFYGLGLDPTKHPVDLSPVEFIQSLQAWENVSLRRKVTLVCWERTGNCHRHVLQRLIEEA